MGDNSASEEGPDVRYVVVHGDGQRLPLAVVRLTGEAEESFTHDLRWEPSDLLSRVPSEPDWQARDVNAGHANEFLVEMVKTIRARTHESELTDYRYYGSFKQTSDVLDLTTVDRLIRRPEGQVEEEYAGHETWEPSDKLHRIDSGLDVHEEYVALSLTEAAYVKRLVDAQWDRGCSHHVVLVDGLPVAAVTKVVDDPDGEHGELAFTGEPEPQPSRLLAQATREPRMTAVRTSMASVVETMARLTIRRRTARVQETAGYAVFHRLTDVLDLDSAYDVVPKLQRRHEFSLPLTGAERAALGARLRVRNARRAARPIDGHFHFAVFRRLHDVTNPDKAYSLLRVPADGSEQWEMFLRDGQWLRTSKPRTLITLPLTRSGLTRVTRRIASAEPRFVEIRAEEGRVALLRLTGGVEETSQASGWVPSELLGRWQDEPGWVISEVDAADAEPPLPLSPAELERSAR
ncbi:hypothetical protein [Lentzea flaviverrucosa]|uniref:Uncharacterized protein n=1 Tax=Lentzea flaviverrucosa TaxID=200379 RepID=A0A1H9XXG7_9PSEU|nr:hypothetical protein [Lentzea flaviverrucosa]RDI17124.1 hypothetical protein DFR72_12287 [Lentzea flaviverrucosa]SES50804.1 hypothetical protein SAMN05216195_12242 [Lentzea flaviverrucosa]